MPQFGQVFRAVQPEQTFHNADMDDANDRTAFVATQVYITIFHGGDNDAGTIDTSDPMWHYGHQAGEFVAELLIHHQTRTTRRAGGDAVLPAPGRESRGAGKAPGTSGGRCPRLRLKERRG